MTAIADHKRGGRLRLAVWSGAAALMVLPVLALRLGDPEPSDPGDYVFLAILLAGVVIAFEVTARVPTRRAYRAGVGFAVAAALGSAWLNLAVGIVGSEDKPINLIYAGPIAVALAGAMLARVRPAGMAAAMTAAAIAQALVFVVALAATSSFTGPITIFFCALWLSSAASFRRAARA